MNDWSLFWSLAVSTFLMGMAGTPHCAAMCAAPCAAALPRGLSWPVVIGRSVGYAVLGALAAQTTAWVSAWSVWSGRLQSLWLIALFATVMLGLWMLVRGAVPDWLSRHGERVYKRLRAKASPLSVLYGMAWAALPCGLLYSAVVAAALAPNALQGGLVMLVFSLPGGALLKWMPTYLQRVWQSGSTGAGTATWVARLVNPQWAVRVSGGMLAAVAAWALSHRLTEQWQAWCG